MHKLPSSPWTRGRRLSQGTGVLLAPRPFLSGRPGRSEKVCSQLTASSGVSPPKRPWRAACTRSRSEGHAGHAGERVIGNGVPGGRCEPGQMVTAVPVAAGPGSESCGGSRRRLGGTLTEQLPTHTSLIGGDMSLPATYLDRWQSQGWCCLVEQVELNSKTVQILTEI